MTNRAPPPATVRVRLPDLEALADILRRPSVKTAMGLDYESKTFLRGNAGKPVQRAVNALDEAVRDAKCEAARREQ